MQAYEFYAVPKNGVLSIPEPYKSRIFSKVKVILLEENTDAIYDNAPTKQRRTDLLSPVSIDTRGWKFDKDEANER